MIDRNDPLEPANTSVYEVETVTDLAEMFGPVRFARMLASLDEEIVQRIETATLADPDLGANAHVLVSVSGTLGFTPLSNACAALERACLEGADVVEPLRAAQAAASAARRAIARLRAPSD